MMVGAFILKRQNWNKMRRELYIHGRTRKVCYAKTMTEAQKVMGISQRERMGYLSLYDPFQDKDAIISEEVQPLADELKHHMLMENVF